ncbi:MAG: hypothetical protein EA396_04210 [Anaerolineaceae bacterium]|nr:MAG: hypothetical protein EA396_04210 [Anaerolineaceae bacterium]
MLDKIGRMKRHLILLFAMLMLPLLSACAGDEAEIVYIVVPNDNAANAPADAAASADAVPQMVQNAPQATPTPDIPPEITLQIGDRFSRDGRFENAVYTYQIILDGGEAISAEIRAAAAYNMAQAALREGLFDYAVNALNNLMAIAPDDYRSVLAYFLRGDAHSGLGMWAEAVDDYRQYLTLRPGVIDSYAYERIGDALINLNQFDAALESYENATQATRSRIPQAALMEKVANLHRLNGNTSRAVAQYDGILEFAQTFNYRASIELMAAQTLLNAGDDAGGLARMARLFGEYQGAPAAYEAMLTLLENGIELSGDAVGQTYFIAGRYEDAIDAFNRFTTEVALTEIPPRLYIQLGQAYRAAGNFDAARVAFRTVTEQFSNDPLFGDALLEGGRTYFMQDDIPSAIERYLFIADTYGYLEATAAEALWRAAYLHNTNDNTPEARVLFTRLAQTYPNSEQARSGLSIAANTAVRNDQAPLAETLFAQLATLAEGTERADAYLNLGRLALERGDAQTARDALENTIAAAPDSFFSARARDLMAGRDPFTPPATLVWRFDDVAEITAAEDWLRAQFNITQAGALWPLAAELEADPRLIRGRELWAVGAFNEARIEFNDIISEYSADGLASYQLAMATRNIGAYRPSIAAAANVIIQSDVATLDAPPFIARLRYPAYYGEEVRRITAEYGIDPLLMLSLIRHESLFDTYATAAADEKGLTQVVPATAAYIAEQLNWRDYQHRDLFRPHAGIEFGAFYLAEQLNRFGGNVYAALGGYNAGPGRAINWLELSDNDNADRFMASITINSTRQYIQMIYNNYAMYRVLYGAD